MANFRMPVNQAGTARGLRLRRATATARAPATASGATRTGDAELAARSTRWASCPSSRRRASDFSAAGGFRGDVLAAGRSTSAPRTARNDFEYNLRNTLNVSLGPCLDTALRAGARRHPRQRGRPRHSQPDRVLRRRAAARASWSPASNVAKAFEIGSAGPAQPRVRRRVPAGELRDRAGRDRLLDQRRAPRRDSSGGVAVPGSPGLPRLPARRTRPTRAAPTSASTPTSRATSSPTVPGERGGAVRDLQRLRRADHRQTGAALPAARRSSSLRGAVEHRVPRAGPEPDLLQQGRHELRVRSGRRPAPAGAGGHTSRWASTAAQLLGAEPLAGGDGAQHQRRCRAEPDRQPEHHGGLLPHPHRRPDRSHRPARRRRRRRDPGGRRARRGGRRAVLHQRPRHPYPGCGRHRQLGGAAPATGRSTSPARSTTRKTRSRGSPAAARARRLDRGRPDRRVQPDRHRGGAARLARHTSRRSTGSAGSAALGRFSYFGGFASAQPGLCDDCREEYGGKGLVDAEVGWRFGLANVALGVRNIFDTYPDQADPVTQLNSFGIFPWAAASPFGYNGRQVYVRTEIQFGP